MSQVLDRVLTAARQLGASDVHLKAGLPPIFRIKGDLRTVRDVPALTREAIAQFAIHMMNDRQRAEFEQHLDIDLAYGTPDGVRYRVNLFQQRGSVGMVMRLIPPEVPPFDRLNLPPAVLDLANNARGVVLVTGATGSGKSTTLAAMIDYINTQSAYHIVTVEDPIEYTFRDKRSVLNQREIGFDTMSFSRALRAALRQDPDVILVGEMRDFETAEIAMTAAETGHLVLSTLHTVDATETVNRIVSMFPTHQQQQARLTLASVLRRSDAHPRDQERDPGGLPSLRDDVVRPEPRGAREATLGDVRRGREALEQSVRLCTALPWRLGGWPGWLDPVGRRRFQTRSTW
jgi:twitching motility protein PilT